MSERAYTIFYCEPCDQRWLYEENGAEFCSLHPERKPIEIEVVPAARIEQLEEVASDAVTDLCAFAEEQEGDVAERLWQIAEGIEKVAALAPTPPSESNTEGTTP